MSDWNVGVLAAAATSAVKPLLVNVRSILHLSRNEADSAFPVRVRGIVTCEDPRWSLLFVQDDTAGIRVYNPAKEPMLRPGSWVEVEGVSAAGRLTPIIIHPVFRVLGNKALPPATPVSMEQVANGSQDGQWVELTGVVRSVSTNFGNALLELAAGARTMSGRVLEVGVAPQEILADSVVRVRGVVGALYNESGQVAGFQLYAPTFDQVTVLQPPVADPFSLPIRTVSELLSYELPGKSGRRARVRGSVILLQPSRGVYLMDSTGGLFVHSPDVLSVKTGDGVDATGFPGSGDGGPELWNGVLKVTEKGRPTTPLEGTFPEVLSAKFDKRLVRFRAVFLKFEPRNQGGAVFLFQSGTGWFQAQAASSLAGTRLSGLEPGTSVEVSGVCLVRFNSEKHAESVSLLLRDQNDVVVLSGPSWWTSRRLFFCLGLLGIPGVAGSIWIGIRSKERKRTEWQLRKQGEALRVLLAAREQLGRDLHDGIIQSIYAVGLALEDCKGAVARSSSEAGQKIAQCAEDLNRVMREVRGYIAGLGADSLSGIELSTALKSLVLTMNASGGCSFVLQADSAVAENLTARQATQLLYVAREAMSNSLRHGKGLSTWVTLETQGDGTVLEVRDDGQGFDLVSLPRAGRGLVNMESRAMDIGAIFAINSNPGKGTVITVRIPGSPIEQESADVTPANIRNRS